MKKQTIRLSLIVGVLAGATLYAMKKLDWWHDDAKDYRQFESHRA